MCPWHHTRCWFLGDIAQDCGYLCNIADLKPYWGWGKFDLLLSLSKGTNTQQRYKKLLTLISVELLFLVHWFVAPEQQNLIDLGLRVPTLTPIDEWLSHAHYLCFKNCRSCPWLGPSSPSMKIRLIFHGLACCHAASVAWHELQINRHVMWFLYLCSCCASLSTSSLLLLPSPRPPIPTCVSPQCA